MPLLHLGHTPIAGGIEDLSNASEAVLQAIPAGHTFAGRAGRRRRGRRPKAGQVLAHTCGCGMKVAECRVKDPNCYYSKGLASIIVASLKAGKNEKEALADAEATI